MPDDSFKIIEPHGKVGGAANAMVVGVTGSHMSNCVAQVPGLVT